jgi:hypothetical protein
LIHTLKNTYPHVGDRKESGTKRRELKLIDLDQIKLAERKERETRILLYLKVALFRKVKIRASLEIE